MKQSFYILFVTGTCAILGSVLAWLRGGQQEDVGSAIGGVAGFAIANGMAMVLRGSTVASESRVEVLSQRESSEVGFAYGVFAVGCFAFVGWLTGYLHDHGDFAGTVCGGLGGFILAVIVPAIHRDAFMAAGRRAQLSLSVVALGAILAIMWAMYKHEFV